MDHTRLPRTVPHIMTLVAITGLAALSTNIFLPSLPGMARYYGVDYGVMQLSVSAYLAMSAVLQLATGPISDRFGRRPVMLWALALFLIATLGTLLAPTAGSFLVFRMMQAVVSAGLVIGRAVVRDTSSAEASASRLGYVTMGMAVVPMVAPVLGGILDEALGWQANFSMMALLGIAVFVLCLRDLSETARGGGISMGQQIRTYPVLARSRRFWGYAMAAAMTSGAFFAYLGGAPFVGATVFHLTPAQVGYWFAAPSVGYAVGNLISARGARFGMNRMILIGAVLAAVPVLLALIAEMAGTMGPMTFFGAVTMVGLGNGMVLPNATAGMMSVRPELAGTASGLGGALAVGCGAGLSALVGALLGADSGATPLLAIMFASSCAGVVAIIWVMARARQLAAQ